MKIIFVTMTMGGGGTERVISLLANYYAQIGIESHILMIGGDEIAYELNNGVIVKALSEATEGSLAGRIRRIKNIRKYIKKIPGGRVIAMGTVAGMFTSIAMTGLKNELIISERNDPNRLNHRPIKKYEKMVRNMLYRRADRLVFQTEMARQQFPDKLAKKSVIILNPVEKPKKQGLVKENVIIAAGRLTEQKNMELLIRAFAETLSIEKINLQNTSPIKKERNEEYILKIFGKGEEKEKLESLIEELKINDRCFLMGFTDELQTEMLKSSIYVSPSNWEGISNSLMEAMACGCGCIATDCPMGGSAMLINNGKNGILLPVGDLEKMAGALQYMMTKSNERIRMQGEAEKICENCSIEKIAGQWLE